VIAEICRVSGGSDRSGQWRRRYLQFSPLIASFAIWCMRRAATRCVKSTTRRNLGRLRWRRLRRYQWRWCWAMDDVADWCFGGDIPSRSQTDDDLPPRSSSSVTGAGYPRRPGAPRSPFQRLSSCDQPGTTDLITFSGGGDGLARCEAMAEGSRMLIEALREKLVLAEEKWEKTDRERQALNDLLVAKKSDYDDMREHYMDRVDCLNDEVQRVKAEKVTAAAAAVATTTIITALCTLVQSAVLRSHVVCLSVCNVGELWSHRLEFFEKNFTVS